MKPKSKTLKQAVDEYIRESPDRLKVHDELAKRLLKPTWVDRRGEASGGPGGSDRKPGES